MPVITILKDKVTGVEVTLSEGILNHVIVDPEYYTLETRQVPKYVVSTNPAAKPITQGDYLPNVYDISRKLNLPLWELTPTGKYRRIKPNLLKLWLSSEENTSLIKSGLQTLTVGGLAIVLSFVIMNLPAGLLSSFLIYVCASLVFVVFPLYLVNFIAKLFYALRNSI